MSSPAKIKRGVKHGATLVAVCERKYSKPIPNEFLPLFEAAGLVVDAVVAEPIVWCVEHDWKTCSDEQYEALSKVRVAS